VVRDDQPDGGYNVYGVVDASGALDVTTRELAIARMRDDGITPISWTTVAAELQRDWSLPTGTWGGSSTTTITATAF
jgi:hypothetical protein